MRRRAIAEVCGQPVALRNYPEKRKINGSNVWPGGVLISKVGMRLPPNLVFEDWVDTGRKVAGIVNSSAWGLGDWLVYGQAKYDDRYRMAIDAVGLDYQTLRNYAWVARRFPTCRRRERLSFQHHAEVASLPVPEQERWLDDAERSGWSRNELRRAIRSNRQRQPADEPGLTPIPRVLVAADQMDAWRAAAARTSVDLKQWIIDALDDAAKDR